MKPDYDVEIDHYYFTFECEYERNSCFKADLDVDNEDDFISRLKDYNQDYEQNPDLDPEVFLTRTDFFNQEYNDHDDVIDEDYDTEELACINVEDGTVEFYEQNDFDRETLKDGFEHLE